MDKLKTKQQKMVEEAEKLARETARKQAQLRRIEKERLLRRTVFETICELSETVSEEILLQKVFIYKFQLNNLDVNSWWEMVEERFLDHLCGFPLCSNKVVMKQLSLYRIDRKNKKVVFIFLLNSSNDYLDGYVCVSLQIFERCTETQKFCGEKCFRRSAYVISQLADEPLWIRGSHCGRYLNFALIFSVFFMISLNPPPTQKPVEQTVAKQPINVEFVRERSVVMKLSDLHIGESAETDDEKSEEDEDIYSGLQSKDNEERMWELSKQMRSCAVGSQKASQAPEPSKNVSANSERKLDNHEEGVCTRIVSSDKKNDDESHDKIPDSNKKTSPQSNTSTKQQPKEEAMLSFEEKMAKLKARCSAIKQKQRTPKIVEAKPLDMLRYAKLAEKAFEEFEKIAKKFWELNVLNVFRQWVGKATLLYLQKRGTLTIFDDEALTEVEAIFMQFCAGDRKLPGKGRDGEGDVILPRVHKYDQALARRDVLYESLLPSWHSFERDIEVEDCAHRAYPLISTFTLSADNVNLDKCEARLAVAFIFRLLAHCDTDLLDVYFPTNKCVNSSFAKYLENIECPMSVFNRMIKDVMDRIASLSSDQEQEHSDVH
ncbi:unnamed protein product [Anisakis simplex]|uniref:protein-serine/threonine phosphatase n=1 Tax=Anisakis simplex TaxID=6269 RepID=A0A0M3K3J6_ANISI|nr:unnamed protein product [Anisakis simplex]